MRLEEIHDVVVLGAADPEVVIGQWAATATSGPGAEPAAITGLLILRVRDGLIVQPSTTWTRSARATPWDACPPC
ncbi:nuclear transport factor 2 family protein [Streptomyces sp. NPDC021100]|uniref:nuclear transport factor 2 family protein n=1 Tax=Streptomyces sp. NPDC021100 TaxID=3365114 RepID=UPI0037AC9ADA